MCSSPKVIIDIDFLKMKIEGKPTNMYRDLRFCMLSAFCVSGTELALHQGLYFPTSLNKTLRTTSLGPIPSAEITVPVICTMTGGMAGSQVTLCGECTGALR